jgi:hypothetical protein
MRKRRQNKEKLNGVPSLGKRIPEDNDTNNRKLP